MKLDKVANSKNDEFYTPSYAIQPILKYISGGSVVWCPFDTADSLFVKELTGHGCNVVHTHISDGQNFFNIEVPECDYIISNPPYSVKGNVLRRLFEIDKPFAMLVGVVGLFESQERFEMFRDNDFEIMYLNRRVAYFKDYTDWKPYMDMDKVRKAVQNMPTLTQPNEPLALEQLREMDGEPVWVEDVKHWALIDIEKGGQWDGVPFAVWAENGVKFTYNVESRDLHCYRRPPEGEA